MHRDYTCTNSKCGRDFSVKDDSQEPLNIAEGNVSVQCPYCESSRSITWPVGHKIIVVPKT